MTLLARRTSTLVVSALWMVSGLLLLLAASWPWTSTGLLSRSDLLQAAGLLMSGTVTTLPAYAVPLSLAVPALGLALVALSGVRRRVVVRVRTGLLLLALVVVTGVGWVVTGADPSRGGRGAVVAVIGLVVGALALVHERRSTPGRRETPEER